MADPLPAELALLVDEMAARGFVITNDETVESVFGNRLLEFNRSGGPPVRLVRDRGLWSAELEIFGGFYETYDVSQALRGAAYSSRALSHEERRRYTLDALDRMPRRRSLKRVRLRRQLRAYRAEH